MSLRTRLSRITATSPWTVELGAALLGLAAGLAGMPFFIFFAGAAALGRYDGASLGHLYGSVFAGLKQGSVACWVVLLGPYGFYVLFRALRAWWRVSAKLA